MPIKGLPEFTLPGAEIAKAPGEAQSILSKILEGKQNAQKLVQDAYANEQMNKYRMGELSLAERELPSKIASHEAMADYYKMGGRGAGGGVGLKDQMSLMRQIVTDNPRTSLEQANAISNAWLNNEKTLPDGSEVPQPSGNSSVLLDRINKGRTTAQQLNQNLNAQGADAEVKVLSDVASDWLKPYGTTYFNMNPDQIMDSFKNDDESQERLGKFIAAQALQYDIAPARARLAGAAPGVTLTNELVNIGMQNIGARYPRLSEKARRYASKSINEALEKGLKARQSIGVNASAAFNKGEGSKSGGNIKKWKVENGNLVESK